VEHEFWHVFAEQALQQFSPTQEPEKALQVIGFVKHHGDIAKFLPEMENLNIRARVTEIAWRMMIEAQIPEDALR